MTAHEATTSSSSQSKLWNYDVFLSFRGEDTRKGFTDHLYAALKDGGCLTFIDDNDLKRGEELKVELFRAIEGSRMSIIVFSKRYAHSSWCLDELVKIMECRSKLGQHVLPIFYHVDPSQVRKQDADLAEAFQKHELGIGEEKDVWKREYKRERVKQWRNALKEAADLPSYNITYNGHEAKLIRGIVDHVITKWLPSTNELGISVSFVRQHKHNHCYCCSRDLNHCSATVDTTMTAHGATSSSSSQSKLWNYDVFLSFRGEDTRMGFTDHLHEALKDRGCMTFMDDNDLKRGEELKDELFRAIKGSRMSIIVFSKRYAHSSWCLDELVKIMECRSKLGQHVLPIFYHVDPSQVRKQDADLAEAFQKHELGIGEEKDVRKREYKRERVKQWRNALKEAADLPGYNITYNGHEAKLIRGIVDHVITKWLPSTNELNVAKYPVGINSRVQDIMSHLSSVGLNDVVKVGILGMGGLGKTAVAKAIYNLIHPHFEFKSFLADVSDTTSRHGLVYLQETLVSDILKLTKCQIRSVNGGISLIKQEFRHRRVLVIVDDIDEVEQLNAIAGNDDWFGPGSIIIITTRDEHLLKQVEMDKIYLAQKLNEGEALELFSWHAFGNSWPNKGYLELSKKVVSYCGGLPLGVEVLGSLFAKRTVAEWKSQLEKLERTPDGKIIKALRISYEGLDDRQKVLFLDISFFFIGWDKDYVVNVLDECVAKVGINVLLERCLVTVERNRLSMHDWLREMARVIISEKSPGYPGKWSRLPNPQEVTDVLTNKSDDGHSWAVLQDRISNLPHEVLVRIVSLLPLKEAAATSILSRRWRHVWAFTTTLSFDAVNFEVGDTLHRFLDLEEQVRDRESRLYVNWVDHVLYQHRGQCIECFRVCFFLQRDFAGSINKWILFAMEKRVQILELELLTDSIVSLDDDYVFPHKLLLGPEKQRGLFSNLPSLGPCGYSIAPFKSLRVVRFQHVGVTGEALEFLLSNCPVLERLSLSFAKDLVDLRVIGPSIALKYLEIKYCRELSMIEISGANIVSFIYCGQLIDLRLNNVPLLVEVSIYKLGTFAEFTRLVLSQLSCRLSHLETLKLDIRGAVYDQNHAFPALSNLKHLELLVDANYCLSLGRLASFMKAAPDLRSLVLGLGFRTSDEDMAVLEKVSKQPHHCLKVVEIAGYRGHKCCLKHVRYLVKNAVALEKIVINPVRFWCRPTGIESNALLENEEENARDHAIQHLKKKVPSRVEFVCL